MRLGVGGEISVLESDTSPRKGILEITHAASPMSIHLEFYEYGGSKLRRRIWDLDKQQYVCFVIVSRVAIVWIGDPSRDWEFRGWIHMPGRLTLVKLPM